MREDRVKEEDLCMFGMAWKTEIPTVAEHCLPVNALIVFDKGPVIHTLYTLWILHTTSSQMSILGLMSA